MNVLLVSLANIVASFSGSRSVSRSVTVRTVENIDGIGMDVDALNICEAPPPADES